MRFFLHEPVPESHPGAISDGEHRVPESVAVAPGIVIPGPGSRSAQPGGSASIVVGNGGDGGIDVIAPETSQNGLGGCSGRGG